MSLCRFLPGGRQVIAPLLSSHGHLRAVIGGVLEGGLGDAAGDDPERPTTVRLSIGCYEIFAGDPTSSAATQLAQTIPAPRELVYGNDPAWRRRLSEVHPGRLSDRPMRSFDPSRLVAEELRNAARQVPERFALCPLDAELLAQLGADLEPHALQVYPSPEAFQAQGVGFGAVSQGELACAATSYAACPGHMEIAVATRPGFRGRGLARATAARLLLDCLDRGTTPHWNASNPVSQRLARRLGLEPADLCEVLYLR